MVSVNHTRPHCVNQMEKTHSKPLAARHGRGTAWARHAMCESALTVLYITVKLAVDGKPLVYGYVGTPLLYTLMFKLMLPKVTTILRNVRDYSAKDIASRCKRQV